MAWSEPTNPVGTYDPAYMTNLYGASWSGAWNTCIYGSPMQTGANVLSNCVGYAQGRMLRLWLLNHPEFNPSTQQTHPFIGFNVDAGNWLNVARSAGYEILSEPVAGSILVTPSHCAVIEKYENGQWWVSESGYGSMPPWVYHNSIYKSNGIWYSSYASSPQILGFFRIPDVTPGPAPGIQKKYDRRRRYRYYYDY